MKLLPAIKDRPVRLGVLISGGGTTMLNFLECIENGSLNAEISLVIASSETCAGVERAKKAGLKCVVVNRKEFASTETFSSAVFSLLDEHKTDLVTLAGFLRLLTIPDQYRYRVLNIHPSLIPSFCGHGMYGHHVHEAVVARGAKVSGCTVHFADNEYDNGPIVVQRSIDLPEGCDADDVAKLVFTEETVAYPEAIRRVTSGSLRVDGRRAIYEPD